MAHLAARLNRFLPVACAALVAASSSTAAARGTVEVRPELDARFVVDSNPERLRAPAGVGPGMSLGSRFWLQRSEKWLELGIGAGGGTLIFPGRGLGGLSETWLGGSLVPGAGAVIELEVAPMFGFRSAPLDPWDEPDEAPGGYLAAPRRLDRMARSDQVELRGAIPVRFTLRPRSDVAVTFHGGGRWVFRGGFSEEEFLSPVVGRWSDGGGAARVEWEASPSVTVQGDAGVLVRQLLVTNLSADPDVVPSLVIGGVGGVVLEPSSAVRLDVRAGWGLARDEGGWLAGARGIQGMVRVVLRPTVPTRIDLGVAREATLSPQTLVAASRTTAWARLRFVFVQRLEPTADFQWSFADAWKEESLGPFDADGTGEHRWSGGGGLAVRVWSGLYVAAGYRLGVLNPSSRDAGEFISQRVTVGVQFRFPGQDVVPRAGDRWGPGDALLDDDPQTEARDGFL